MRRYDGNPIITREDIPILPDFRRVSSILNPGAYYWNNTYILLLQIQDAGRRIHLVTAFSKDGLDFTMGKSVKWENLEKVQGKIYRIYNPRITRIDDRFYILLSLDTDAGSVLGLGSTLDFSEFIFHGIVSEPGIQNGVLFPEKIHGRYARLEHGSHKIDLGDDEIYFSTSPDLLHWKRESSVMKGRSHYWDERIASGPAPIKTKKGWLLVYHGIAEYFSPICQIGVALLEIDSPCNVIARSRENILEPQKMYETVGRVPNICFSTGMIIEQYDEKGFAEKTSGALLYYGAAATTVAVVTTRVEELISYAFNI